VLGDEAYGKNTELRARLDRVGIECVLSINADANVYDPGTAFTVPERGLTEIADSLGEEDLQTLVYTTREGEEVSSRFATLRVIAAHPVERDRCPPRGGVADHRIARRRRAPSDYWISNLPADTAPEGLARLARLPWMIELDYRQLKGELGLDHYEGRSYLGFHHHCAIVTAAHGFLTLERADQIASGRPDPPSGSLTAPVTPEVLNRPLLHLPTGDRPRQTPPPPPTTTRVTTYQSPSKSHTRKSTTRTGDAAPGARCDCRVRTAQPYRCRQ
jgi:hypothetical protein